LKIIGHRNTDNNF